MLSFTVLFLVVAVRSVFCFLPTAGRHPRYLQKLQPTSIRAVLPLFESVRPLSMSSLDQSRNENLDSDERMDVESFLRNEMTKVNRDGDAYSYRSEQNCIVRQAFPYIERVEDAQMVTDSLVARFTFRTKDPTQARDKMCNHLTALPGAPGIGKSTFMVHYPESESYKQYCQMYYPINSAPIVSTLTFNSGMEGAPSSIGLRILYGAAVAMGIIDKLTVTWEHFAEILAKQSEQLEDARKAVDILRRLFGDERPMLILVDELSKSPDDDKIMKSLGYVLALYGNTDILVSSLSPQYVSGLMRSLGSQRPIEYILLNPLLDVDFGDCPYELLKASDKLINDLNVTIGEYERNALLNLDKLFSGHPRSVENFVVKKLQNTGLQSLVDTTKIVHNSTSGILLSTAMKFSTAFLNLGDSSLSAKDAEVLENYVLKPSLADISGKLIREYYDAGDIIPFRVADEKDRFQSGLPLCAMLKVFEQLCDVETDGNSPRIEAAKKLFNLRYTLSRDVATWWERAIDLTIASRYFDIESSLLDAFRLDCSVCMPKLHKHGTVRQLSIVRAARGDMESCDTLLHRSSSTGVSYDAVLMIPPPGYPGYDSRWTFIIGDIYTYEEGDTKTLVNIYSQVKSQASAATVKKSTEALLANVLAKVITEHVKLHPSSIDDGDSCALKNVHVVYYVWGGESKSLISRDTVVRYVRDLDISQESKSLVGNFIEVHWEQNVHIVSGLDLDNWLLPSLRSIPRILASIHPAADK